LENAAENLPDATFTHNEIIKVSDGEYQIDGTIRFQVMGVSYLTLVECKKYKGPISREKVQVLFDKIRAVGAQKGILVTTSYFQKGALDYASNHGIALIQIVDGKVLYCVRDSSGIVEQYPEELPKFAATLQHSNGENTISYSQVLNTKYLVEHLLR